MTQSSVSYAVSHGEKIAKVKNYNQIDTAPAGGGLRRIKAVVTVEAIDRSAEKVTLKGPLGNTLTVYAVFPERLEKVKKATPSLSPIPRNWLFRSRR